MHQAGLVLGTRATNEQYELVKQTVPQVVYDPVSRILKVEKAGKQRNGFIAVCTGGTADIPVAEEAAQTAEFFGSRVERIYDVGVAGIHRLLAQRERIVKANCVIAVAGMEGALGTVIGGLVENPVIAVPTSIGYGASFHGLSALLTMINSCANGISVVNIAMLIEEEEESQKPDGDSMVKLETNLDDCTGEALGFVMEELFHAGAADVWYTPIYMKKSRPAYLLSVLCKEHMRQKAEEIIFMHTTTIGIRRIKMERTVLERECKTVETKYGDARIKICKKGEKETIYPEYECVKRIAREYEVSFSEAYREIKHAGFRK